MLRTDQPTMRDSLRDRFLSAIAEGSQAGAAATVDAALAQGLNPKSVYFEVVVPAQNKLGELWNEGRVTLSQEYAGTQITLSEIGRLRPLLKRRRAIGKLVVVSALEDDPHVIGGRIVSDFLFMEGWDVDFLGSGIPAGELVSHVQKRRPEIVGLSVTLSSLAEPVTQAIGTLKKLVPAPKVIVGGRVISAMGSEVSKLGADAYCSDAQSANTIARELVGLPCPASSLPEYLKTLGERIQTMRKSQNRSQQDLANASGLERAYISAIEHGKHNITLGAVMKLSGALQIPFEELLVGDVPDVE